MRHGRLQPPQVLAHRLEVQICFQFLVADCVAEQPDDLLSVPFVPLHAPDLDPGAHALGGEVLQDRRLDQVHGVVPG
jgi:hypothetical protein